MPRKRRLVQVPLAILAGIVCWPTHAGAQVVSIGVNFAGGNEIQTNLEPPDSDGAIGPSNYVQLINGFYGIYNKSTGALISSESDQTFWQNAGLSFGGNDGLSDTRIVYDPQSQRWFASEIDIVNGNTSVTNNFLVGVSATSNPTGAWHAFKTTTDTTNNFFGDYPTLGVDANGVYQSMNGFANNGFSNNVTDIVSYPKSGLLAATPTIANLSRFQGLNQGNYGAIVEPVMNYSAISTGETLIASVGGFQTSGNVLHFATITGAGAAGATLSSASNLSVTGYSDPPGGAENNGNTLNADDSRIGSYALQVGNSIWVTHETTTGSGRSGIRWYQINATTHAIMQSGVLGDASHDYIYPSIAANANGTIVIGCTASSTSEHPSSVAFVGFTNGVGVTNFNTPLLLKSGTGDYGGSRWGDFSQTEVDPSNSNAFWTVQEISLADGTWSTQVTQIKVAPGPESALVFVGGFPLMLAAARRRRARRTQS